MAKKRKKAACTVRFREDAQGRHSAVLFDRRGRSINLINYPRGETPNARERTRARRVLMAGCAELSRRRGR